MDESIAPALLSRLSVPSENAWRDYLYPADARPAEFLGLYSRVFNAVEGNTTFYARPAPATVERWAQVMPTHFRFTAKFPGDVTHEGDLREHLESALAFTRLMAPLGERVSPYWLQLSAQFGPSRLGELCHFLDQIGVPVAVEVRNEAFSPGAKRSASSTGCCTSGVSSASAWTHGRCSVAPRASRVYCMHSPRNHGSRHVRLHSASTLRCDSSGIRCWRPTRAFSRPGWKRLAPGSKKDAVPMSFAYRRQPAGRSPGPAFS